MGVVVAPGGVAVFHEKGAVLLLPEVAGAVFGGDVLLEGDDTLAFFGDPGKEGKVVPFRRFGAELDAVQFEGGDPAFAPQLQKGGGVPFPVFEVPGGIGGEPERQLHLFRGGVGGKGL